jgi:hypothetical protein
MIPLAISIAILDELTRHTCLETNAPFNAALVTAVGRSIVSNTVHDDDTQLVEDSKKSTFDTSRQI